MAAFLRGGVFHKVEAVVEIQLQAQFLCGTGARTQAGTELIEHVSQEEGQRFEQYERVLEFYGFFKDQRGLDRDQCS